VSADRLSIAVPPDLAEEIAERAAALVLERLKDALKEILVAAEGRSLNSETIKQQVREKTGASPSTAWRAFSQLRQEGLAGATPTRDKHGVIGMVLVRQARTATGEEERVTRFHLALVSKNLKCGVSCSLGGQDRPDFMFCGL
jgi:hypothetical protein